MEAPWNINSIDELDTNAFSEMIDESVFLPAKDDKEFMEELSHNRTRSTSISTVMGNLLLSNNDRRGLHAVKSSQNPKAGKSITRKMSFPELSTPLTNTRRASISALQSLQIGAQPPGFSSSMQMASMQPMAGFLPARARSMSVSAAFPTETSLNHPRPFYCNDNDWNHINCIVANVVKGSKEMRRRNSIASTSEITAATNFSAPIVPLKNVNEVTANETERDCVFDFLDEKLFETNSKPKSSDSESTLVGDDEKCGETENLDTFDDILFEKSDDESSLQDTSQKLSEEDESSTSITGTYKSSMKKIRPDAPCYDPERPLLCPHENCGKRFTNKMNLRSHLRIHDNVKNYPCTLCSAEFRRCHDLKRHVRSLHTGVKMYLCDQCGKRFSRADALKRHLEREGTQCYNPIKAQQLHSHDNKIANPLGAMVPNLTQFQTVPVLNSMNLIAKPQNMTSFQPFVKKPQIPIYGFPNNMAVNIMNNQFHI